MGFYGEVQYSGEVIEVDGSKRPHGEGVAEAKEGAGTYTGTFYDGAF